MYPGSCTYLHLLIVADLTNRVVAISIIGPKDILGSHGGIAITKTRTYSMNASLNVSR